MVRKIEKHPYVCLIILIFLTGTVLYSPFIFGEYIFAYSDWGYDTKHSFLPIYEFYAQRLADFRWDNYDFSYGLGTSVFANIYIFLDPFSALNIFMGSIFGEDIIGFFLIIVHWAKNIALGCLGLHYLRMFRFSNVTSIISSYVIAFCGFIMITGQHYQFATYAVLYMCITIMCEKFIRNEKWWIGLALSLAVVGVMGPYPMFQTLIALGIYSLIRVIQEGNEIKKIIIKLLKLIGIMILGLMISMFAFLPQCYEILSVSNRISNGSSIFDVIKDSFSLLPKEYLESGFFRLFSNNLQGLINSWEGPRVYFSTTPFFFSLFFPFCIAQYVARLFDKKKSVKEKLMRVVILGLMVFIFTCKFIPAFSNMFSYIEYRFTFVILPVFLMCFAETIEDLFVYKKLNVCACVAATAVSIVLLVNCFKSQNEYSIISLKETILVFCMLACVGIAIQIVKNKVLDKVLKHTLFGLIAFSLCFDAAVSLYIDRAPVTKTEYAENFQMPYLQKFQKVIEENEGDNFVRVDRTFLGYDGSPDIMCSFICPVRTVSVYNNTLSRYTVEFVQKLMGKEAVTQIGYSLNSYGNWFDNHTADLLGLKYIVSQSNVKHEGWKIISEYNGYYLYQNEEIQSTGLLYDKYITTDEFEKLDDKSKCIVTKQSIILDKEIPEIEKKISYTYDVISTELEFETIEDNGIQQFCLKVPENIGNGIIELQYSGKGVYYLQNEQKENLDSGSFALSEEVVQKCISISSDVRYITIVPDDGMEINLEVLQLCRVASDYDKSVKFSNAGMGNVVEGKVEIEDEKILYMPITYDSNWKVFVNGQEAEIIRADYGFMGVILQAGENTIRFEYHNRWLYIGIWASVVGLAIMCALIVFSKRGKKR